MPCTGSSCPTRRGPCPLAVVAALLFLAALLGACASPSGPPAAPPPDARPADARAEAAPPPERLTAAEFVARVRPGDVVLDVRTPSEFASGHLAGAVLADVTAPGFEARVAALDRDRPTYVYCRTGRRSRQAAEALRAMGFRHVVDVGGFEALAEAGAPTASD